MDDHQVEVAEWSKFSPAVSADSDEGDRPDDRNGSEGISPHRLEPCVGLVCEFAGEFETAKSGGFEDRCSTAHPPSVPEKGRTPATEVTGVLLSSTEEEL